MSTEHPSDGHDDISFVDDTGQTHQIPQAIVQICTTFHKEHESPGVLGMYLYKILHTAASQQQRTKGGDATHFVPLNSPQNVDEAVDVSNTLEGISRTYESVQAMQRIMNDRTDLLRTMSRTDLQSIEQWMGVDTVGLTAGDQQPLLGVDSVKVRALIAYLLDVLRRQ